jgi:predicted Rossmann fold nucleotide-binding protein DprA/Smf involved in DNA uptake
VQAREAVESEERNLLATDGLNGSQKTIYDLLKVEKPRPIDAIVVTSGLNSSVVLATLLDVERKGMVWQIPGKQFRKVPL